MRKLIMLVKYLSSRTITKLSAGLMLLVAVSFTSSTFIIAAQPTHTNNIPVKDKWALVVGVSKFRVPNIDLRYAADDAMAFASYLTEAGGFKQDHVKVLTNSNATRLNILKLLGETWLPQVVDPDDLVVIYLGSHGTSASSDIIGVNYILTHDTLPGCLYATAIPTQDFLRLIRSRVPAKHIVLVLDTCFSGSAKIDESGKYLLGGFDSSEFFHGTGQAVMSSSSSDQPSLEVPKYKSGLFTHHLIDGFKTQGPNTTITQAFTYTQEMVKRDSRDISRDIFTQVPVLKCTPELEQLQVAQASTSPHNGPIAGRPKPTPIEEELEKSVTWSALIAEADKDWEEGNLKEAARKYRQAVKLADITFGDTDTRLATSLCNLANVLDKTGRSNEADQVTQRALAIAKHCVGTDHTYVGNILGSLSSIALTKGLYAKAEEYCKESVHILEKQETAGTPLVYALARLGLIYLYQEKYKDGEELTEKALELSSKLNIASKDDLLAALFYKRGVACRLKRNHKKSEEYFKKALEIRRQQLDKSHPKIATTCLAFGMLYNQMQEPTQARPLLWEAASIMHAKNMGEYPLALAMIAQTYEQEKKMAKADQFYQQAVTAFEHNQASIDEEATVFAQYGKFLLDQKEYKQAITRLNHCIAIFNHLGLSSSMCCAFNTLLLAKALCESGNPEEANRHCTQGMEVVKKIEGTENEFYGSSLILHAKILEKMGKAKQALEERAEGNRIIQEYQQKHH